VCVCVCVCACVCVCVCVHLCVRARVCVCEIRPGNPLHKHTDESVPNGAPNSPLAVPLFDAEANGGV
jgi:hypothetical protein